MSSFIIGLDEAGRGPLAGPVSAGCVLLPSDFDFSLLNDSKKLTEKKREKALEIIKEKALWGVGFVDHNKIDEINILNASLLAMEEAFKDMMKKADEWCKKNSIPLIGSDQMDAVVDGLYCPKINCKSVRAEVKADGKYPEVMAASIVAKVLRDNLMKEYDKLYPEYGYAKHKGYPTKEHKEICRKLGPSPIQRKTFNYN